jgi:hypothetical protein
MDLSKLAAIALLLQPEKLTKPKSPRPPPPFTKQASKTWAYVRDQGKWGWEGEGEGERERENMLKLESSTSTKIQQQQKGKTAMHLSEAHLPKGYPWL